MAAGRVYFFQIILVFAVISRKCYPESIHRSTNLIVDRLAYFLKLAYPRWFFRLSSTGIRSIADMDHSKVHVELVIRLVMHINQTQKVWM